jgi:hypothetical protein
MKNVCENVSPRTRKLIMGRAWEFVQYVITNAKHDDALRVVLDESVRLVKAYRKNKPTPEIPYQRVHMGFAGWSIGRGFHKHYLKYTDDYLQCVMLFVDEIDRQASERGSSAT